MRSSMPSLCPALRFFGLLFIHVWTYGYQFCFAILHYSCFEFCNSNYHHHCIIDTVRLAYLFPVINPCTMSNWTNVWFLSILTPTAYPQSILSSLSDFTSELRFSIIIIISWFGVRLVDCFKSLWNFTISPSNFSALCALVHSSYRGKCVAGFGFVLAWANPSNFAHFGEYEYSLFAFYRSTETAEVISTTLYATKQLTAYKLSFQRLNIVMTKLLPFVVDKNIKN